MKKLSLALSLAFGATALADVPALINYQGRLVDGVGNPVTGSKAFKLDIYDSQTEGTLIYQETLPDITLDEDGAYSFQFGAGESRSETSVLVATGDGEAAFFQKVFEETPVGVISVTDGTNTFKTGDVPTGEEPFSFTYTASLKRLNLVCNEPPAVDSNFIATFRYAESGIMGALGSAAEHWMEVTIEGDKQEPRQRLVAVPFALTAFNIFKQNRTLHLNTKWTGEFGLPRNSTTTSPAYKVQNLNLVNTLGKTVSSRGPNSRVQEPAYRYLDDLGDAEFIQGFDLAFLAADRFEGVVSSYLQSRVAGSGGEWQDEWFSQKVFDGGLSEPTSFIGEDLGIMLNQSLKEWRVLVTFPSDLGVVYLHSCKLLVK
ncbi:hypothetical protein N9128_06060 [Akkermansiaceae bacterium]|nr:hypothetical protein [Akkermansiaceae bacterium]